jgi:hypothetical protein
MHPPDFDQRKTTDDLYERLNAAVFALEALNSKLAEANRVRSVVIGAVLGCAAVLLISHPHWIW